MRVKVWKYVNVQNPDEGYIGEGEFIGHVPMSEVITKEEAKKRFKSFLSSVLKQIGMPHEGAYFDATFEKNWARKEEESPYEKQTTPKIILDSGEVVYGCQIWWQAIEEEKKNEGKKI